MPRAWFSPAHVIYSPSLWLTLEVLAFACCFHGAFSSEGDLNKIKFSTNKINLAQLYGRQCLHANCSSVFKLAAQAVSKSYFYNWSKRKGALTFARRRTFHRKSPCCRCSWLRRKLTCFESCRMNPVWWWTWRSVFCQIRLRSCWRDSDSWRINGLRGLSARNAIRCAPTDKELGAALYSWQSLHPSDQTAWSRSDWLNAGFRSGMAVWRGHLTPCQSFGDPCFSCRLRLHLCCY